MFATSPPTVGAMIASCIFRSSVSSWFSLALYPGSSSQRGCFIFSVGLRLASIPGPSLASSNFLLVTLLVYCHLLHLIFSGMCVPLSEVKKSFKFKVPVGILHHPCSVLLPRKERGLMGLWSEISSESKALFRLWFFKVGF